MTRRHGNHTVGWNTNRMPTRLDACSTSAATAEGAGGASPSSRPETVPLVNEKIAPINEAALARDHDLIHAIVNAKVSGQVMSPDEFKAWLNQQ
jgi:hypothetical protein